MTDRQRVEALKQDVVKELLDYDPATGAFTWKARSIERFSAKSQSRAHAHSIWNARYAGTRAGNINNHGYVTIRIGGRAHKAHRLAWIYMTGKPPAADIDHINGVRSDNRFSNLRAASRSQNIANAKGHRDSHSGIKGVCFCKKTGKWSAGIMMNGEKVWLGKFQTAEEASSAYASAAKKYFGDYARTA